MGHRVPSLPFLPLKLKSAVSEYSGVGMLDTGSMVNVIPFNVGLSLGGKWDTSVSIELAGNLAQAPSKSLLLVGIIPGFRPVTLSFAWSSLNDVPIILGHLNFFQLFDVSFSSQRQSFTLTRTGLEYDLPFSP